MDEGAAVDLARRVLVAEGIDGGELGLAFVGTDEMRALKREHLGIDEATDVLSFPIDGRDELPDGMPRALRVASGTSAASVDPVARSRSKAVVSRVTMTPSVPTR